MRENWDVLALLLEPSELVVGAREGTLVICVRLDARWLAEGVGMRFRW